MARNTPTEILDNVKRLLVRDIINLWETSDATLSNNVSKSNRNFEFDIKLKLLTNIVDMEVNDGWLY